VFDDIAGLLGINDDEGGNEGSSDDLDDDLDEDAFSASW
jgi:hypothetical protein